MPHIVTRSRIQLAQQAEDIAAMLDALGAHKVPSSRIAARNDSRSRISGAADRKA